MDTIMPLSTATFSINDTTIEATLSDHTQRTYTLQGQLIANSLIRDVTQLKYNTQELVYPTNPSDDEYYDVEPYTRMAVATCLRYEAECDWYGLMSPDGKMLTPPSYVSIEAVGKDLYLCKTNYGFGVLLNSKGIRVQ